MSARMAEGDVGLARASPSASRAHSPKRRPIKLKASEMVSPWVRVS